MPADLVDHLARAQRAIVEIERLRRQPWMTHAQLFAHVRDAAIAWQRAWHHLEVARGLARHLGVDASHVDHAWPTEPVIVSRQLSLHVLRRTLYTRLVTLPAREVLAALQRVSVASATGTSWRDLRLEIAVGTLALAGLAYLLAG